MTAERDRVRELLGREPQGKFDVVVRDPDGDPVVLRNAPLLDDGTPMPTRYWLVGDVETRRIAQLEAAGGVDAAEAAIDPAELAAAHQRYATERDAALPDGYNGPRPSGGVGGTRRGVKCLHAHWAWHLAGGDDPVGRWIERQLHPPRLALEPDRSVMSFAAATFVVPWGYRNLSAEFLADADPPAPASLTNALAAVGDYLDDCERQHPSFGEIDSLQLSGAAATALARLETGRTDCEPRVSLERSAIEEVFRLVAVETHRERAENPGLPDSHHRTIVATLCIVLAVLRHLRLDAVSVDTTTPPV